MTERNEPGEEGGRRRRRREPERESGDNPLKHARILQRRWEGSAPPTAERYARALRQWRALPGAVVSPGTGLTTAPAEEDQP
jgi:hypothetical protein